MYVTQRINNIFFLPEAQLWLWLWGDTQHVISYMWHFRCSTAPIQSLTDLQITLRHIVHLLNASSLLFLNCIYCLFCCTYLFENYTSTTQNFVFVVNSIIKIIIKYFLPLHLKALLWSTFEHGQSNLFLINKANVKKDVSCKARA